MTSAECAKIIAYLKSNVDTGRIAGGCCDPERWGYHVEEIHAVLRMFVTDDSKMAADGREALNRAYGCDKSPEL